MWIKPRFFLGLALAMLLWFGAVFVTRLPMFHLREVQVSGAPHVSLAQTQWVIQQDVRGNLFTVDLDRVRADFGKLPWVRSVDVRRRWPDALDVVLSEHQAVARWNDDGLVGRQGEVFRAASNAHLPHLSGPDGSSVRVMQMWRDAERILAPTGRVPVDVALSARGNWRLTLDNGVVVALGTDDQVLQRLARWVGVYPAMLAQLNAPLLSVDLRYPQGFAVRLAPDAPPAGTAPVQGKMS